MTKTFSYKMANVFPICKVFFVISEFAMIEEMVVAVFVVFLLYARS